MPNETSLEIMASKILDVSKDPSEDEVQDAYRRKSKEWHPDISDDPEAGEMFKAVNQARDILIPSRGEFSFSDADDVTTAKNIFTRVLDEDEVEGAIEEADEASRSTEYRGSTEKRTDPSGYSEADFTHGSASERSDTVKTVALGIETRIIFDAVSNLYSSGYSREDFFNEVNEYVEDYTGDSLTFSDFYEATDDNLRPEVTEELYVNTVERQQESLEEEYGQGTTISEVAKIISYFMVHGSIDLGMSSRFVGSNPFGEDSRFGRDERFSRGGSIGGGSRTHGRDERFDR